jgi:hypothetical protein
MKKIILLFFIGFSYNKGLGQFQELSLGVGFSYYYGDLNLKNSDNITALFSDFFELQNTKMSYSLGYRYNFQNFLSIGLNLYHMYLSGYDSDNKAIGPNDVAFGRKVRNLSFHTAVNEAFIDLRIEPFRSEKRWEKNKMHISPYLGVGVGFFNFNPKAFNISGREIELQPIGTEGQGVAGYGSKYSLLQMVIPINAGIRFAPKSRKYSLGIDFNYNHTFTDYLDDVSTTYANPIDMQNAYQVSNPNLYKSFLEMSDRRPAGYYQTEDKRGNRKDNDFFMTGQVKFSYFIFNNSVKTHYKCCDL